MQPSNKNAHLLNLSNSINVTHSSLPTEKSRFPPLNKNLLFEKLNIETFKRDTCKLTQNHNHKQCIFYHNNQDRKRSGIFFSEDLCDFRKNNQICPKGDLCDRSHNQVEQLYRIEKFKKKFCLHYPKNLEKCEYGRYCSFAHDEIEVLTDLIHNYIYNYDFYIFHYKTVSCPFNLNHHQKSLCVYAHNWQDFRRKPNHYNYQQTPCPYWNPNDHILNYEKGCPNMLNCQNCHGWKEAEYHPLNYKTKKCPNDKNCRRNQDCPHYHNFEEQRIIGELVQFQFFKPIPINRIVENTFKVNSPRNADQSFEMSKPSFSMYSVDTKVKESITSSSVLNIINRNSLIENEIETLQILKESERIRKFSLKANPNIHLELLKKNKARRSCKDSEKMNIREIEQQEEEDFDDDLEDDDDSDIEKDSFISNSQILSLTNIPMINRKQKTDEKSLSIVFSGNELIEDNEHYILNQILE